MTVRTTHRVATTLAGAVFLLVVSGCAAASPSTIAATPTSEASGSSGPSVTPQASSSASLTPGQPAAAGTWTATGKMVDSRGGHRATLLADGRVLVTGGYHGGDPASAELYDPISGTWTATGSMIEARDGHAAALLRDGRVLVAGGDSYNPAPHLLASAELYDPISGTWTATGSMIEARWGQTATLLLDGSVLVTGVGGAPASAELFDPSTETWTATGKMMEHRGGHTATLLRDGRVLVAGGFGYLPVLSSAELYDPDSGTWTATGNMAISRDQHTAVLLSNGMVLVAGGHDGVDLLASAELYDPGRGSWIRTGSMAEARISFTATLLSGGQVLVAGGSSSAMSPEPLASVELYNPVTGSWTAAGDMIEERSDHTVTLLANGQALVAGGCCYDTGTSLTSAELYDPGSGA